MPLSDNPTEALREIYGRIARLERATLLLAIHVGAVGWNHELQQVLDGIRENLRVDAHTREG
jgi:hypothetical protein